MAASNVVDLLLRFKGDSSDLKSTMAQVRSELASSQKSQQAVGKSELSMKQQLAAASSLQRQRSAALIGEWKKTEHAASMLARGVKPVSENLQRVTDAMGALRGVSSTLEGPLGAVSGRLGAVSALAAKLGPVGGGIALAIAGMTAMVVVTGLLAKATFDVIKSTADWQGKLFDLSQQVGVSVETLNALEISARKTGGSIESIAQALVIYQGNLDEAQDASSKAGKQFSELGISTDNTEQSFRDAFTALAAMEVGFHQTNTAAELFGRRGGKQVLAIIKETNGDIDSAVTKLGSLSQVTTEQARAADEFNDAMVDVGIMIRGVTALVVQDAIPQVLKVLEGLSTLIKENKDVIDALGGAFTAFIRANVEGVLIPGLRALKFVVEVTRIAWAELEFAMLKAAGVSVDAAAMIANARLQASRDAASIFAGVSGGFTSQGGPTAGLGAPERAKGGGGKGETKKDTALQDANKEAALAQREALQLINANVAANKRALEEQVSDIETFTKRAIELEDERLAKTLDRADKNQLALDTAFKKANSNRKLTLEARRALEKEYDIKNRELTLEVEAAVQENIDETFQLEQRRDREISAAQLAADQRRLQMIEEADQRIIDTIKYRVDQTFLLESEGERQIAEIVADAYIRRKKALDDELVAYGVSAERKAAITDELIRMEGERAGAAVDALRKIQDALKAEAEQRVRMAAELSELDADIREGNLDRRRRDAELLLARIGLNARTIALFRQLTLDEETERHKRVLDEINSQQREAHAIDVGGKTKLEIEKKYNELREQERQRFEDRKTEINAPDGATISGSEPISKFEQLRKRIDETLTGNTQTAAIAGLEAMTEAFSALGQAVGQAAYAWVLYGNAGTSIRKITAEILASVAQQSLVKSVFQLAEGFAALFLNPAEAAAHFKAAAIYASIGGIAAIAGRAAAGNSFNQGSSASSGFGSASGGSNSSRGGGGNTSPITLGSQRPQVVHLVIEHRSGGMFDSRVVSAVVKSANGGGAIREAVIKEIKRQE